MLCTQVEGQGPVLAATHLGTAGGCCTARLLPGKQAGSSRRWDTACLQPLQRSAFPSMPVPKLISVMPDRRKSAEKCVFHLCD